MGQLVSLEEWRKNRFKTPVSKRTAQGWASKGYIAGAKKIGRLWFIDEEAEKNSSGDDVVDAIMAGSK